MQISHHHFPEIIRMGDVLFWEQWDIDWSSIDMIIGGSPCQGFSFSGKELAFEDPRSILFFKYLEILQHIQEKNNDVIFFLENVRMKTAFSDVITGLLGYPPILVNSSLICPQSRPRLYWSNKKLTPPEERATSLHEILEPNLPNCGLGGRIIGRRLNAQGKREDYNKTIPLRQYIEVRKDGKQNCLTTVYKDTIIPYENYEGREVMVFNGGKGKAGDYSIDIDKCRMMTPLECERLQTLPDQYTASVSQAQRYKAIGNAWTVDVIAHFLKDII